MIRKVTRVARWGNGLVIRIPPEIVEAIKLKKGERMRVRVGRAVITFRRANAPKKCTEIELLERVTPAICGPDLVPDRRGKELI